MRYIGLGILYPILCILLAITLVLVAVAALVVKGIERLA